MGVHDFESGLYRIDLMTIFNNTDNTTNWFEKPEISQANNVSTILFEIANADITLLQADVSTASPMRSTPAYTDQPTGQQSHNFAVPMLNGVIEGIYEVTMKIVDEDTGRPYSNRHPTTGPSF